jgi:hypothetical protein
MRIFIARIKQRFEYAEIAVERAFSASFMSERQAGPYDCVARKWLALAERRRAHLIELRDSGRWKHYCTDTELDAQLLEVTIACLRFAAVAGPEPEPQAAAA